MKKGIAVYLRKSRMDPNDESIDETLNRHYDILHNFANEHKMEITEIYKEVVSGDSLFTRPEMLRLLSNIESGLHPAVLCMAIDRLGRSSQKDGGIILETFKENDTAIITPQKTYNLKDEFDETSVEMQSFLARQELKSIKRRLSAGIRKSLEDGFHITEAPYGYERVYINKRPTLKINETEAEAVKIIFDMYINRSIGCGKISGLLNSMGYTTRKGNAFSRNSVNFILQNPIYTGKIVWNRKHRLKKKTLYDKNRYITNPEDSWIVSEGIHSPIISNELFMKAQEIRLSRANPPISDRILKNPFAGLVYCDICGSAIIRQSANSGKNISMLCPGKGCTRSIKFDIFEKEIINCIVTVLNKEKIFISEASDNCSAESASTLVLSRLNTELKNTLMQKNKLYELLERGIYSEEIFLLRSKELSEKEKNLHLQIKAEKSRLLKEKNIVKPNQEIPFCKLFPENYFLLSPSEKNSILKKLISRISYSHDKSQSRNEFTAIIEWNKNL